MYTCIHLHIFNVSTLLGCMIKPMRVRRMFFSKAQRPREVTIFSRRGIQDPASRVSCNILHEREEDRVRESRAGGREIHNNGLNYVTRVSEPLT